MKVADGLRLRYLGVQSGVWDTGDLPASLQCFGTEPFWSFRPRDTALEFSTPEAEAVPLRVEAVLATGVFRDPRRSVVAQGASQHLTAVLVPKACSDGMSDRAWGIDVTLVLEEQGTTKMLTGCCSIAPR